MDPQTQPFGRKDEPKRASLKDDSPTYEAVDPFKPSIAFSLRKAQKSSDFNVLEDDRPPVRITRPIVRRPTMPPEDKSQPRRAPNGHPMPPRRPQWDSTWQYDSDPVVRVTVPPTVRPEGVPQPERRLSFTEELEELPPSDIPHPSRAPETVPEQRNEERIEHVGEGAMTDSTGSARPNIATPSAISSVVSEAPGTTENTPPRPHELSPSPSSLSLLSDIVPSRPALASDPPRRPLRQQRPPSPPSLIGSYPSLPQSKLTEPLPVSPISIENTDAFSGNNTSETGSQIGYLNFGLPTYDYVIAFTFDTLPRQIYLNLLLRLPYLYFSRVTRIFEEAEMSMPMIRQGILDAARANANAMGLKGGSRRPLLRSSWGVELEPASDNAAYNNLQASWLAFIDTLLQEWQTLNIISVLLLSAILTILQIPTAASDPLTRSSALLSMICALMSLVYGCIYIIRFATMKKTYKGAAWAQEAQRSKTEIWWNIWVMLAMPATWLAWSLVLFVVTITAFVWRSSPFQSGAPPDISPPSTSPQILVPRVLITTIISLGVLYFILIAFTLRRYGSVMDRAWQKRIWGWMEQEDEIDDDYAETNQYPTTPWYTRRRDKKRFPKDEEERYEASEQYRRDRDARNVAEGLARWQDEPLYDAARPPNNNVTARTLSPLNERHNVGGSLPQSLRQSEPHEVLPRTFVTTPNVAAHENRQLALFKYDGVQHASILSQDVNSAEGLNVIKLCDLPLSDDYVNVKPSEDDLKKCGFGLEVFNFPHSEGWGWKIFAEHLHSIFNDPTEDPPDTPSPDSMRDSLWLALELWTAKLQFHGVTGYLASCEPKPGDLALPIYYFHQQHDHPNSPSAASAHLSASG